MTNPSKTALVTGGNRGIGLAIVAGLAEQGIRVLLACRDVAAGERAASSLAGDIHVVALDLSRPEQLLSDIEQISAEFPKIDILVNNAGVLDEGDLAHVSRNAFMQSMQVNALTVFDLIQHFAGRMSEAGYGRVVNVSSGWGAFSDGLNGPAAYSVSKATLNALTKVAAQTYTGDVKINAMCPGWVRTQMGGMAADRSPEQGAETAIWLATLNQSGPNGQFFRDKTPISW